MNNKLDTERLDNLMKDVWKIACGHGWHDKPISRYQYLALVMTEVAEAIEADRNGRRADTKRMETCVDSLDVSTKEGKIKQLVFKEYYHAHVKGSVEEEFADIVIRILDMAQDVHGGDMKWFDHYVLNKNYVIYKGFVDNAYYFIREVLDWRLMNVNDSVVFMFEWAEYLGIDLWQHIEWKMKYNELRPYKHGGKKY